MKYHSEMTVDQIYNVIMETTDVEEMRTFVRAFEVDTPYARSNLKFAVSWYFSSLPQSVQWLTAIEDA